MPTLAEISVLILLIGVVVGFFVGFGRILTLFISLIIFAAVCIAAGVFIGIGISLLDLLVA